MFATEVSPSPLFLSQLKALNSDKDLKADTPVNQELNHHTLNTVVGAATHFQSNRAAPPFSGTVPWP